MVKYYVECGDLKRVLMSTEPFKACVRAMLDEYREDLNLGLMFVVSERGFVTERQPTEIYSNEEIYSVDAVMDEYLKLVEDQ